MGLDQWIITLDYNNLKNNGDPTEKALCSWRKESQIQRFFERRIMGGVRNCKKNEIKIDDIIDLKRYCEYILKHPEHAQTILPTMTGPFFGSADYGQWYLDSCASTIKKLEKILENHTEDIKYFYLCWY